MALHLHRAERTDQLAEGLAELLATPLPDPFAEEVVIVPEHGIERWLAQRLSHRLGVGGPDGVGSDTGLSAAGRSDGVCAGVRFDRPTSLLTQLLGRERDDPWLPRHLAWTVLQTIDEHLDEPWCAPLARHLGHDRSGEEAQVRAGRRYSVALRLAHHLHRYGVVRPQVLTDWAAGRDEDGAARPLAEDLRWQAELYRRVAARIDEPPPDVRHARTVAALREGAVSGLDLPDRLSLFGHTRLAVTEVELLAALGATREVHLWLPQPSPALWEALARRATSIISRREDDTSRLVAHPLLASLGRDSRELVRVLSASAGEDLLDHGDLGPPGERPATLLGWLQEDIRSGRAPDLATRAGRGVASQDESIGLHAAHGPHRQVEVLREVLVGLLEDDPTLEPRDVLVMCPDVETYAPLIGAAFGLGELDLGEAVHPAHRLRVRLADRALGATNPVLEVAARVVDLSGSRFSASQVLDLLALDPIRRRFRLDEDAITTITSWITEAGVRWGWDAAHRAPFGLPTVEANTWRAGLDRILLGVAVSADGPTSVGGSLPLDGVGSGEVDLAGRLAELLERLVTGLDEMSRAQSAADWTRVIGGTVRGLVEVSPTDAWQLTALDRVLAEAGEHAPEEVVLRLPDVQTVLQDRFEGRPTRSSFRTGTLTVCTMVPMRSVPHRVICLLGLDDGSYPRQPTVDGDDVLARAPLTGERDARSEDRQLLLDAIMAATERLVVVWSGADERSGAYRPPAVPVGELLDAARETTADPERPAVIEHPLQPFDPRNLTPGALVGRRSFTFDPSALSGAKAGRDPVEPPALLPRPLASADPSHGGPVPLPGGLGSEREEISLAELISFLQHPARAFLRDRVGISLPRGADELSDAIPLQPQPLERWSIGDRVLTDRRSGTTSDQAYMVETLRGHLPPGRLGREELRGIQTDVEGVLSEVGRFTRGQTPVSTDVAVTLLDGRRLTGTVDLRYGDHLVDATYSRVSSKHEIATWVRLLALVASEGVDETHQAAILGKGGVSLFGPLPAEAARAHLSTLAEIYALGQRVPVLVPVKTGDAWARAVGDGTRVSVARKAALSEWSGRYPESEDAWWQRLLGSDLTLERLLQPGPGDLDATLATCAPQIFRPLHANRRTPTTRRRRAS